MSVSRAPCVYHLHQSNDVSYAGELCLVTEDDEGARHRSGADLRSVGLVCLCKALSLSRHACYMQAATVALMLGSTYFATAAVLPAEQQQSKAHRPPS